MFFIILLGLFLRLTYIIKPEGMWNDEYVSWMVSNTSFHNGFWTEVSKQCHMPLYYLYLKPFSGFSDIVLRITSVIPGVISIYIMYLVGREYSKKTGIFAALITSVLSFLIYYSQEVRFYSLLFMFSAISLLFTLKLLKNTNKINITAYVISLLLIVFTHVLGIFYVLLNIFYVLYKKQCINKNITISLVVLSAVMIPVGIHILHMIPSSQWWGHFSYTNILFLLSDYFSPILTNNVNAPPVFFYNKSIALWMVIPTLIGCVGLLCGIKRYKGLFIVSLMYVIILSILALCGKLVFITKYSIEILPVIIFLTACGYDNLKKIGIALISLFVLCHLSCLPTPYYVTKIFRSEGHKLVGDIINSRKPENIIFTYYEPDRFDRYISINNVNVRFISKINRFEYIDAPEKIQNDIKKGESVSFVFLDSVSFFPEEYMQMYTNLPEMFVTFSKIKNSLLKTIEQNYKDYYVDKSGSWTVVTAIKNK